MRLKILRRLSRNEASVGEIVADVGGTQANVSKHLAILLGSALLGRRKEGTRTFYAIKDPSILRICSIVCDGVERGSADTSDGPPRRRRSEPSTTAGKAIGTGDFLNPATSRVTRSSQPPLPAAQTRTKATLRDGPSPPPPAMPSLRSAGVDP
ncbi:MAG: helix-turn-helix transcriptional regulator [Acidobacteria bacterium]|nr:helix-turn-helix transcriptional regulator [Acidobacteriota bacterium]